MITNRLKMTVKLINGVERWSCDGAGVFGVVRSC